MFKVRASGAGKVMTDPSSKSEALSKTCKTYVRNQWIADHYHREKDYSSRAIQKGLLMEEEGITMLSLRYGEMLTKNEKWYQDKDLTGTPDVVMDDTVCDIKCSYDIWTFAAADGTDKDYKWQLQVYMELLNLDKAALVYCLTDTPDVVIQAEMRSIAWKLQMTDEYELERLEKDLRKQLTFSDIPVTSRIKIFNFERDKEGIARLRTRVEQCRDYYESLTL